MALLLFSFCLFVFVPPLASATEPYYMVTVPAQMVYPSQERACVLILHLQGEIKLKMALKKDDTIHQVAEDTINTSNYLHCYSFQLFWLTKHRSDDGGKFTEEKQEVRNSDKEKKHLEGKLKERLPATDTEVWLFHVSMDGEHLHLEKTKKVLILKLSYVTFIQTDKPNYKPGQTVNFRIVTLDTTFRTQKITYPLVEMTDPDNNRIAQWLDVTPNQGIASLSFPLANELSLGDYIINIPGTYKKTFSVSEYVLKRFDINIEIPSILNAMTEETATIKACSRYTYGKPAIGLMSLSVCKIRLYSFFLKYADPTDSIFHSSNDNLEGCIRIDMQTDDKGCLSRTYDLRLFNVSQTDKNQHLKVRASMTEKLTGNTEYLVVISRLGTFEYLNFFEVIEFYQQGVPLTVKLMLRDRTESPKVNETVYLVVGFEEKDLNLTAVTDEWGIATFNLDTSSWEDMVSITGKLSLEEDTEKENLMNRAFAWVHPFYSESKSFLKVLSVAGPSSCDSQQAVTVEYFINKNKLDPESDHQSFFYILMGKEGIVSHGEYKLDITEQPTALDLHGTFSLKFSKVIELFPKATILVFTVLLDGDIAASRTKFQVPMCPNNKVQIKFSKDQVHPGEVVSLEVKAESGSLCSVRSVDKGLLLHNHHDKFNLPTSMIELIIYSFEVNRRGFPYKIEDFEKYPCFRNEKDTSPEIREGVWYYAEPDVYRLLKESNLKTFTNLKIRKPVLCSLTNYTKRISPKKENILEKEAIVQSEKKNELKKSAIRRLFPETWLFDLVSVGPYGSTVLNLTTPDSITKFDTDAFCLGKSGFGEMSNVMLTTFKPYFIELTMPYSVVQGEKFTITALVYNYLKECIMVFSSLSGLGDRSKPENKKQTKCICAEESTSLTWNVTASNIGNLKVRLSSGSLQLKGKCTDQPPNLGKDYQEDNIEKTVFVKPSGVLEEKMQASVLCPPGDSIRTEMLLNLPDRIVPGSDEALVTVIGDLMGSAIAYLGNDISHSEGSGERNLVKFLPNVQIVKYLEATNQMTPKIKSEALSHITKGYQRQLLFKSVNGSYSVFHGYQPSTWLTAFTLKSFVHAQELIYIQEKHIEDAVRWLSRLQKSNGCFEIVGSIFQDYLMKEGEDEVTLTAYITITLLEHRKVFNDMLVDKALKCLKDSVETVNCTYTQALMAYAFTLSGDGDLRKQMLESLEKSAEKTAGTKYWGSDSSGHGGVAISAYVLLTILSDDTTSQDIEEASSIVSWMVKQQRPQGGFYSTQDMVVGLQAFTKYAKATYRDTTDLTVSIRSLSGFQRIFHVDKTNRLLLQREHLPDTSGVYTVTATGNGCAYVQTYLKYNTPPENSDTLFTVMIITQPAVCTHEVLKKFDLYMEIGYRGEGTAAKLVMIEVDMLSGFFPVKSSLKKLEKNKSVFGRRIEATGDRVTIYVHKLTREPVTLVISMKQEEQVNNLQPAIVKVYEYSNPDKFAVAEYNSPCSTGS